MARTRKGRKVRCCVTGEYGTDLIFFKAPDGRYYQSEQLYNERLARAETHRLLIDELMQLLEYQDGQVFPTSLPLKLKELDFYGDEIILKTIRKCRNKIEWAIQSHEFPTEYAKVSYVMAIVRNHINDVYLEEKQKQKCYHAQNLVCDEFAGMDLQTVVQESKDISQFLEDEL